VGVKWQMHAPEFASHPHPHLPPSRGKGPRVLPPWAAHGFIGAFEALTQISPRLCRGDLTLIRAVDERLLEFYTLHHKRFWAALLLSSSNWLLGMIEISGTFFIPSSIGAQEAAFTMVCSAITGMPSLGLAALVIRRSQEIVWILTGLGIWWWYSLQPGFSDAHEQTLG
jgi:hypothetical protein